MMPFTFTKWTTRFVVVQLLVLHVKLGTLWLKIVMSLYACVATQWEGQGCTFALSCCTTSGCCLTCTHKRLRTSIPCCNVALHVLNRFDFIINKNVWGCGKRLLLSQSCRCYSQLRWPVCLFPAKFTVICVYLILGLGEALQPVHSLKQAHLKASCPLID